MCVRHDLALLQEGESPERPTPKDSSYSETTIVIQATVFQTLSTNTVLLHAVLKYNQMQELLTTVLFKNQANVK